MSGRQIGLGTKKFVSIDKSRRMPDWHALMAALREANGCWRTSGMVAKKTTHYGTDIVRHSCTICTGWPDQPECIPNLCGKVRFPQLQGGATVMMGSLSSRNGPGSKEMIEAPRASLKCLPRCGADLTLMEVELSKPKDISQNAPQGSLEGLLKSIGHIIDNPPVVQCKNHFRASGFDPK